MDIPSPPPQPPQTTAAVAASPTKNLDLDSPIHHNTTPKHVPPPFTNGVLKRHKPRHHHHLTPPPIVITYKECLKNHAAAMGGHAVDGCGEFMPSPTSTPTDPTSLKCAACGCHRNFHRRDPDESFTANPPPQHIIEYQPHHRHHPPPPPQPISVAGARGSSISPADSPSPPPICSSYYPSVPHMLLALNSGFPETTHNQNPKIPISVIGSNSNGKKRFRTKFTQDQKQKMHELAERVGWKMQKKDENLIINLCSEIGVEKGVFKVWMHNNKMTFGVKKDDNGSSAGATGIDFFTNINTSSSNQHHQYHQQQDQQQKQQQQENISNNNNDSLSSGGGGGNVMGTNGSSSSAS